MGKMKITIPNPFLKFDRPEVYKHSINLPIVNPYIPPKRTAFYYQDEKNFDKAQKAIDRSQKLIKDIDEKIGSVSEKVSDMLVNFTASMNVGQHKLFREVIQEQTKFLELQTDAMKLLMTDTQLNQYVPDYLVTPGEILEEYLESLGMTQAELATRMGLAKKTVNEIIKAKSPITPETALKLERVLGRPAHFWNNLERQYQENKSRLAEKEKLASLTKGLTVYQKQFGWATT